MEREINLFTDYVLTSDSDSYHTNRKTKPTAPWP